MTHRDNLLSIFRRTGYDRIPVQFSLCPALVEEYKKQTGSELPFREYYDFPSRGVSGPELPEREPVNWFEFFDENIDPETTFNSWGVGHEPGGKAAMHMKRFRHPMKKFDSLEQIQAYPYPDFINADYSHIADEVQDFNKKGLAAMFVIADMVWEIAWYMRGMEELMMDMAMDDEKAVFLLDKTTELACYRARKFAEAGLDILHSGDDVGMQQAMMMAPDFWREWLKPRMAKVIQAAKDAKPNIIFSYHSCGFIEPIIEDLIEIGVDVLNPVQPECMDFREIHAQYGDRLSFWGTIGTQTTMPFGSPDDVRNEVIRNLEIAGEKGGLLCNPTHLLEPEVPWANIEAYINTCKEF